MATLTGSQIKANAAARGAARSGNIVNPTSKGKAAIAQAARTPSTPSSGSSTPGRSRPSRRTPETGEGVPGSTPLPSGVNQDNINPLDDTGFDLRGSGNPTFKTEQELTDAFDSIPQREADLDDAFRSGDITRSTYEREKGQLFSREQYDSALKNLKKFGTGVDPLGFGNNTIKGNSRQFENADEAREFFIGTHDEQGNFVPSEEYLKNGGTLTPDGEATIYNIENGIQYQGASNPDAPGLSPSEKAKLRGDPFGQGIDSTPLNDPRSGAGGRNSTILEQKLREIDENTSASSNNPDSGVAFKENVESRAAADRKKQIVIAEFQANAIAQTEKEKRDSLQSPGADEFQFPGDNIGQNVSSEISRGMTIAQGLLGNKDGVSSQIFGAYLPGFNNIITRLEGISAKSALIDTAREREDIAASSSRVVDAKRLARRREDQLEERRDRSEELLRENRNIMVEANNLSKESLALDKEIFKEKAKISEARQMAKNIDDEKKLRRSLNSIGIESSPEAQVFLQDRVNEAADALEGMITTNNLTMLKFSNAREGLNNDLRSVLTAFEGKLENLNSTFDENIFNLDDFVNGVSNEVIEELREDWKSLTVQEDALYKEAATKIEIATLKAIDMQSKHELAMTTQARSDLKWATETWGSGTPAEFKQYLNESLPGIDIEKVLSAETIKEKSKSEKEQADAIISGLAGKLKVDGKDVGLLAARSLGRRSYKQRIEEAGLMTDMINSNDVEGVKEQILITSKNSFRGPEQDNITDINDGLTDIKMIEGRIASFDDKHGGIYKDAIEDGKLLVDMRDKEWLALKADIGAMQAEARKRFAGVAVTDAEQKFLAQWMVDFSTDSVGEMEVKLNNMKENGIIKKQTIYDDFLGQGAYKFLTGEGVEIPGAQSKREYDDSFFNSFFKGEEQASSLGDELRSLGRITQEFDTPIASKEDGGLYNHKTVLAWKGKHAGVDIAIPQGSEFKAPVSGKIVDAMDDEPGWGGTVIIRDENGAEHRVAHLSSLDVKLGDTIEKGLVIGKTGGKPGSKGSGNSTGPHLDYRVRMNGKYLNPLQYNPNV